jgi:hypothetical protein
MDVISELTELASSIPDIVEFRRGDDEPKTYAGAAGRRAAAIGALTSGGYFGTTTAIIETKKTPHEVRTGGFLGGKVQPESVLERRQRIIGKTIGSSIGHGVLGGLALGGAAAGIGALIERRRHEAKKNASRI